MVEPGGQPSPQSVCKVRPKVAAGLRAAGVIPLSIFTAKNARKRKGREQFIGVVEYIKGLGWGNDH